MSDNVLLIGAGFSKDAGVPTIRSFVDRMWEYAKRRSANGAELNADDVQVFENAIAVRNELDRYHGRAEFDDRNLEDILSILWFNALAGGKGSQAQLHHMNRAIARTIELACEVTHPGVKAAGGYEKTETGKWIYRAFWQHLLNWAKDASQMPALITLNYDLVLERALLQVLVNTTYGSHEHPAPFKRLRISYHSKAIEDPVLDVQGVRWGLEHPKIGTQVRPANPKASIEEFNIELLKLHGSVNFPRPVRGRKSEEGNGACTFSNAVEDPHIVPPISNKLLSGPIREIWKSALNHLRSAKRLVIIGYSLPQTDTYMQYFLKAGLGPNNSLERVLVFDPVLHRDDQEAALMENRFRTCFSSQLQKRLSFRPAANFGPVGSLEAFVGALERNADELLF